MLVASAKKFVSAVNDRFQTQFVLDRVQSPNRTARARTTLHVHDAAGRYLIELATDPIQHYYLNKNVEWPQKHLVPPERIKYLTPLWHGRVEDALCAVFAQATVLGFYDRTPPAYFLSGFAAPRKTYEMDDKVLDRICDGFLQGWPPSAREHIRRLDLFQDWRDLVLRRKAVELVNEHGDFSANNILVTPEGPLLIDFEFAKSSQIDGYDLFYNESTRKVGNSETDASKLKLHRTKLALCHAINDDLDFNRTGVIFHARRLNHRESQFSDLSPWIEILDYPAAASIELRPHGDGVTLGAGEDDRASRQALEALPGPIAEKLVSRWHRDGIRLYAMNLAADCAVGQALLRYGLPSLLREATSAKKGLQLLRRLLNGKMCFAWSRRLPGGPSRRIFFHGNLKYYLTHRIRT